MTGKVKNNDYNLSNSKKSKKAKKVIDPIKLDYELR
jgi:hypothetical protein